jgi:hypothetical protein
MPLANWRLLFYGEIISQPTFKYKCRARTRSLAGGARAGIELWFLLGRLGEGYGGMAQWIGSLGLHLDWLCGPRQCQRYGRNP